MNYKLTFLAIIISTISSQIIEAKNTVVSVAEIITPDGTIRNSKCLTGEIDLTGHYIYLDDIYGPIIKPLPILDDSWISIAGINNEVYAIAVDGDNVYVGGLFTNAGGVVDADGIALWDGASWSTLGTGIGSSGRCYAIEIHNNKVYVGGFFSDAGGVVDADNIAYWDGTSWNAVGSGINQIVTAIALYNGLVHIGGLFVNAGGNPNSDYIAFWNGNWNSLGTGTNGTVNTLEVIGSTLYASGSFSSPTNHIGAWDGANWSSLGVGLDDLAAAIIEYNGDVYVGGSFFNAGGNPDADKIAYWDGADWHEFAGAGTLFGNVTDLEVRESTLYACSSLAGGYLVASWDDNMWTDLSNQITGNGVLDMALGNSDIYVGGTFFIGPGTSLAYCGLGALPVELLSFIAKKENATTRLEWETENESNNDYFQVERSSDGVKFTEIGQVASNSSQPTVNRYSFIDEHPSGGINYYRLKQVDYDGTFEYSKTISITAELPNTVQIYPNPTYDYLFFTGDINTEYEVTVTNGLGKTIETQIAQNNMINIQHLPKGSYIIIARLNGVDILAKRIIKTE